MKIGLLASLRRSFSLPLPLLLLAAPLAAQIASAPEAAQRLAWREQANELGRHLNYDESKVGSLTLPDPLLTQAGRRVATAEVWWRERRPEILQLFSDEVYGRAPAPPRPITWKVTAVDRQAFGGLATRKRVTVYLLGRDDGPTMDLLVYIPKARAAAAPAFVALNYGNHTVGLDPAVPISATGCATSRICLKRGARSRVPMVNRGAAPGPGAGPSSEFSNVAMRW